jgi:hypothetical protein
MSALFKYIDALLGVLQERRRPTGMHLLAAVFIAPAAALAGASVYFTWAEQRSVAGIRAGVSSCLLSLVSIGIMSRYRGLPPPEWDRALWSTRAGG